MAEELARHRCIGDDGTSVVVVEHRHVFTAQDDAGTRQYRGAAWMTLLDGEPVRFIDTRTFEVVATGELLAHEPGTCDCMPAPRIATFDGSAESVVNRS